MNHTEEGRLREVPGSTSKEPSVAAAAAVIGTPSGESSSPALRAFAHVPHGNQSGQPMKIRPAQTLFLQWLYAIACVAIALAVTPVHAQAGDPAGICISFAENTFAKLELRQRALVRQCECVRRSQGGRLPSAASWDTTGPGSPGVALVECAKKDVIDFYSRVVLLTAESRMTARGLTGQQIRDFGACVGNGAYEEMRRIASSTEARAGTLDGDGFRRMYELCEPGN